MKNENEYSKEFSEDKFWTKVKNYAMKAGKEVVVSALTLFYTMNDKGTPMNSG